jgi:hypothetical protein
MLAVLALLATTFATMQATERQVSRNYLDMVRAKLLAQSGVEDAMGQVRRYFPHRSFQTPRAWRYYGDQTDEALEPILVPLERAKNPSFAVETDPGTPNPTDANTAPRLVQIDGELRGFSGAMESGTYGKQGDQYALQVTDLSGLIYVNDGLNGDTPASPSWTLGSVSQNLRRILNVLGRVPTIDVPGLGDQILAVRREGYAHKADLLRAVGGDQATFARFKDFVTVHAWVDPHVANPVPLSGAAEQAYYPLAKAPYNFSYYRGLSGAKVYRYGRGVDVWGSPVAGDLVAYDGSSPPSLANGIYAMDELHPQWIEVVSRAPVNVNHAPREVLIALLADLQGTFLSYRRRNNIEPTNVGGYWFAYLFHTFSPQAATYGPGGQQKTHQEGDEYGFLYKTCPIRYFAPGETVSGPYVDAPKIADEIIACREAKGPYASAPFGGAFKTWRQFNAFCDSLVATGAIEDTRPIFYDYQHSGSKAGWVGNISGDFPLVASDYQRVVGSQAIADALKANFNPNLHLNELNPDENLHLRVDKTDLIAHSTEFIFTPTGYFEIASVGRVLMPESGTDALAPGMNNRLVAEQKVVATVQFYDQYRETTQSQFSQGTLSPRQGVLKTNSNRSLEIGPEVDNGPAAARNEWDGYVALPTVGGLGVEKPKEQYATTPGGGSPDLGEKIRVHFQWDYDASYQGDGVAQELAQSAVPGESVLNFPDKTETYGGPYDPVHGAGDSVLLPGEEPRHRLASSFRLPGAGPPALGSYAPLDLRVDGAYVERHASPAWWISKESFAPNIREVSVVASFWVKPSYPPDRSGKPRTLLHANRQSSVNCWGKGNESHFSLWYNAGHDSPPYMVSPGETVSLYGEVNIGDFTKKYNGYCPFRHQSFIFGRGYGNSTNPVPSRNWVPRHWGSTHAAVNHDGHPDGSPSPFRAHRWTHVIVEAKPPTYINNDVGKWSTGTLPEHYRILINGVEPAGTMEFYHYQGTSLVGDLEIDVAKHANGQQNSIRLGVPSQFVSGYPLPKDNFSCDATVDEFYLWNTSTAAPQASTLWFAGRYYKPLVVGSSVETSEGVFTSGPIQLTEASVRMLAPPSLAMPPLPAPPVPAGPGPAPLSDDPELLGLAWTLYGEESGFAPGSNGLPKVLDHTTGTGLPVGVQMYVKAGSALYGPWTNDGFSGLSVQIKKGEPFRYLAKLSISGLADSTILTSTPVLDDVTVYYRRFRILSYGAITMMG